MKMDQKDKLRLLKDLSRIAPGRVDKALDMALRHALQDFPGSASRRIREGLGIPQHVLATAIGIRQPHVANMESGVRGTPSLVTHARWVAYLYGQKREFEKKANRQHRLTDTLKDARKELSELVHRSMQRALRKPDIHTPTPA